MREATQVAASHLQIHAHRDALTYVMTRAGSATRRGRRRAESEEVPMMQELHFPMGGHRFRPALEDVLEMLIDEFGIDNDQNAREALKRGRLVWRQTQTKSAVRDDPESAWQIAPVGTGGLGSWYWCSGGLVPAVRFSALGRHQAPREAYSQCSGCARALSSRSRRMSTSPRLSWRALFASRFTIESAATRSGRASTQ